MPLALSTLGLPGTPLDRVVGLAADHGWHGLELRCASDQPVRLKLSAPQRRAAARTLGRAGLVPVALASYIGVAAPGPDEPVVADLLAHLRLAADLGCHRLRVFPHGGPGAGAAADARAVRRLLEVADHARSLGVRILVETHDSHRSAGALAALLDQVGHPAVGALWDLLHTWLAGENPAETHRLLGRHLGYAQVKDVASADDLTPVALGGGVLPIADCLRLLPRDGWIAWEYETPWHPRAAPLAPQLGAGRRYLAALIGR
ncbi:Sugar phosphate isomerase/epimerase [Streptomyces sp. TLI_053]|uniref:sugar phosphate isomerase/epimerase family protein n=1 Tax=Streptomyces sp. TLI_053 TaxID=1855352 RepID=UPI00087A62B6|nr:sugar phosphate isomerase/epimerase family protein [Streptomyces sp. TLI_053]SDS85110.1 Sugar phosphate isomerase/epimerase [Streptomyces sp. TLI_053]